MYSQAEKLLTTIMDMDDGTGGPGDGLGQFIMLPYRLLVQW